MIQFFFALFHLTLEFEDFGLCNKLTLKFEEYGNSILLL